MNKREFLKNLFAKYNINLSEEQIDKFLLYYDFLIEENSKFNLTAITEFEDVAIKHFLDSGLASTFLKGGSSVIDVGSGAGFPGVVLKILRDDLKITLLDSLNKRVNFLNQTIKLLNLKDIIAVHARVEDFAKAHFQKFDYATSRAVASLPTLSEYLLPLVKMGGEAVVYKAQKLDQEIELAQNAIKVLGGKITTVKDFFVEETSSERKLLFIKKLSQTPKIYPRGKNLPKTKPIE